MHNTQKTTRFYSRITNIVVLLLLIVFLFEAWMQSQNNAWNCKHWPLCTSEIMQVDLQVLSKSLHRIILLVIIGPILLWSILYTAFQKNLHRHFTINAGLSFLIFLIYLYFEAKLYITQSEPYRVFTMSATSLFLLGNLLWTINKCNNVLLVPEKNKKDQTSTRSRFISVILLCMICLQFYMGNRIDTKATESTCNTFPACYNEIIIGQNEEEISASIYFPSMQNNFEKEMSHRFVAYAILLLTVLQLFLSRFFSWPRHSANRSLFLVLFILFQIFIGALSVIFNHPEMLFLFHVLIAYLIFLFMLKNVLELYLGAKKTT